MRSYLACSFCFVFLQWTYSFLLPFLLFPDRIYHYLFSLYFLYSVYPVESTRLLYISSILKSTPLRLCTSFLCQFFFSFLGKSLVSWDVGMLDLLFIRRWNLVLGIPDCFSVIMEACVSGILGRIQWMLIILNIPKLWPLGIQWMLIIVVIPKLCHLLLYL